MRAQPNSYWHRGNSLDGPFNRLLCAFITNRTPPVPGGGAGPILSQ